MSGDGGTDSGTTDAPTAATPTTDAPAETTTKPTTTTTPEADGPLAVGDEVELSDGTAISVDGMGSSIFVLTQGDGGADVEAETGTYYVLVTFGGQGIGDYESFVTENATLVINEQEYGDPVFTYTSGFTTFTAAYQVPADLTPYTGRVKLETADVSAAWEFDAGVIESITQSVSYAVSSVSIPDAVAPGAPFGIDVTVENGGDPMTFLGQVFGTRAAPVRVRQDVPGSDAKTFTVAAKAPAAGAESEFDVTLDWGADSISKTIPFE